MIVATGAGHRHLGLESEARLEKKVTYCATCDGALPMFRNQPLVVVGGGDSACEEALYLTRFASAVYLVHRRDQLRASKIMADRVLAHAKIKPVWDSVVTEILDVALDKVTGVRLKQVKTGAETHLPCAGVFVAIGHVRHTDLPGTDRSGRQRVCRSLGAAPRQASRAYSWRAIARIMSIARRSPQAGMGCMAAIEAERYLAQSAR